MRERAAEDAAPVDLAEVVAVDRIVEEVGEVRGQPQPRGEGVGVHPRAAERAVEGGGEAPVAAAFGVRAGAAFTRTHEVEGVKLRATLPPWL